MGKVNFVVATHGEFGKELINSAKMLIGEVDNVTVLSLMPGMSFEEFVGNANETIGTLEGPTICFVDIFGGTPSNSISALIKKYPIKVITGLNLPMFLETYMAASQDNITVDQLVETALSTGNNSILLTNDKLSKE